MTSAGGFHDEERIAARNAVAVIVLVANKLLDDPENVVSVIEGQLNVIRQLLHLPPPQEETK